MEKNNENNILIKLKQKIKIDVSIIYCFIFFIILFICICISPKLAYSRKIELSISNYFILLFGIMSYFIIFIFTKCLKNRNVESKIIIITVFFTFFLFFWARNYSFKTDWDVKAILDNASFISQGNTKDLWHKYYSIYPNNLLLTYFFSVAFKIATLTNISDGYNLLLLLQCFIYAFTGYLVYKISYNIKEDEKVGLFSWLIYIALIGFSPWVVIPYSDSISLGIVGLLVFILVKMLKTDSKRKRLICDIAFTFLSVVGYFIKPQTLIIFIAFFIIEMLKYLIGKKNNIKRVSVYVVTIVITFCTLTGVTKNNSFRINKENSFGISHFLMMGWNPKFGGVWNENDVNFSMSFDTKKERKNANLKIFKQRIQEMGVIGVNKMIIKKTLINYNDGTFAYGREGKFFLEPYNTGNKKVREQLNKIYIRGGKYYSKFQLFMQIIWMGTLFFNIFSFNKEKKEIIYIMQLSILGLTLFELLFEARARYLFAYAPVYIILAVIGFNNVYEIIKKEVVKWKKCQ